jgi:hypothetical protein
MSMAANSLAPREPRGFARFWRAIRQIFHEVMGALFAILALAWINLLLRAWNRDAARWATFASIILVAIFAAYAISSFRRARRL